jgi:WD40 repeat protein
VTSTENEVLVWFIGSKEPKRLEKVEGDVRVIQFLPDNSLIALGYEDGSVRLYDPFSLRRTFNFPNRYNQEIKGIKFSPSSDAMVSGSTGGVWVWAAP